MRTPSTNRRLNVAHPLFTGLSNLWLPLPTQAGGRQIPDHWSGGQFPTLTNGPTWQNTQYGPGVETGVVAVNAYIDVNTIQLSRNCSVFFAFRFRYDATTSGANTETGIIWSAGHNSAGAVGGISFRTKSGTLELLKSHIASILSGSVTENNGEWHTAGFTIDNSATANFTLYWDGVSVATAASATTFTGSGTTTLGYDSDNSTPEYGRHTFLGVGLWAGRVLTASDALRWHDVARQRFRPLFRRATVPNLTPTATTPVSVPAVRLTFGPTRLLGLSGVPVLSYPAIAPPSRDSANVPKAAPPVRLSFGPTRLLGLTGVPVLPRSPVNPPAAPAPVFPPPPITPSLPNWGGLWLRHLPVTPPTPAVPNVTPAPPGPRHSRVKDSMPRVQSVATPADERRLGRMSEMQSNITNALIRSGQLQREGPADWKVIGGGFEAPRAPTSTDDSDIGAVAGCTWVDTTASQAYVCLSNGVGSATWQVIGSGGGGSGTGFTGTG